MYVSRAESVQYIFFLRNILSLNHVSKKNYNFKKYDASIQLNSESGRTEFLIKLI